MSKKNKESKLSDQQKEFIKETTKELCEAARKVLGACMSNHSMSYEKEALDMVREQLNYNGAQLFDYIHQTMLQLMVDRRNQLEARIKELNMTKDCDRVMSSIQRKHEIDMLLEALLPGSKQVLKKLMEGK